MQGVKDCNLNQDGEQYNTFERITHMKLERNTMSVNQIGIAALLIVLTLISGLADAQGFVHAANIWQSGKLIWPEVIKSASGFALGIVVYWICIRFLQDFRIISPEIQTLGWFTATIIGVALF